MHASAIPESQQLAEPPTVRSTAMAALLAFAVFVGHAFVFGSWIVDDAGISFAYARNLAEGEGLVAQPGEAPTEGFSNALWTLLLALIHRLGLFDPVLTPKIVASILVLAAFLLVAFALVDRCRRSVAAVGLALAASAASTPFVVWTVSGLENALSVFLVSALAAVSLRMARGTGDEIRRSGVLGFVCFLLFLTRPDGIVFLAIPPFLIGVSGRESKKSVRACCLAFLAPWTVVTACRLGYFGDLFPNTFYAKKGPGWRETLGLVDTLGVGLGGTVFVAAVIVLVVGLAALARRLGERTAGLVGRSRPLTVIAGCFLAAYIAYEALPTDWMPEYRFGTSLFLLGPLLWMEALPLLLKRGPERGRQLALVAGFAAPLVAAILYSSQHSLAFRRQPTVPFDQVRQLSFRLESFAEDLGVDRATVLLPDIGGSLWENRFDVIDMAGLIDRTLGRTIRSDRDAYLRHVLDRRPDLVWVHGYWQELMRFDGVAPFTSEYAAATARSLLDRQDGALYVKKELIARSEPKPRSAL